MSEARLGSPAPLALASPAPRKVRNVVWKPRPLETISPFLRHSIIALAGACSASACSWVVDADRAQCQSDSDCSRVLLGSACVESLCESPPEWACLSAIGGSGEDSGEMHVTLPTLDTLTRSPVAGLSGKLCQKLDVACERPRAELLSDSTGNFQLSIDPAFDGYVQIEAPSWVPALYFLGTALSGEILPPVNLLEPTLVGSLVSEIDAEVTSERGIALLSAQDCFGQLSEGIRYESGDADAATVPFYAADGLPSLRAAATDASGYGGFINLRSGPALITGWLPDSSLPLGSTNLLIRAGAISMGRIAARRGLSATAD